MKIFINIYDTDYSVGKKIDELISISNGKWQNFNQFRPTSFSLLLRDTENCEFLMKKTGNINLSIY